MILSEEVLMELPVGLAPGSTINNEPESLTRVQLIYRGTKTRGGITNVDNNENQIIYLKKGDKLQVRFYTCATYNMNTDTNNIYINKDQRYYF